MLEIKDLTIQYGEKNAVVENFSLTMQKGEIISILGENGSGKTTLSKIILGILKNYEGEIFLNGKKAINSYFTKAEVQMASKHIKMSSTLSET